MSVTPQRTDAAVALQLQLLELAQRRLRPTLCDELTPSSLRRDTDDRWEEERFIVQERRTVARLLHDVPQEAGGFVEWFENLARTGPGQQDPLFPWLATHATRDDMRWFLGQEAAGEAGFDDLLALTQLSMPLRPRIEMTRNLWDEMGRGLAGSAHGPLLSRLIGHMDARIPAREVVWESLALANLMVGLAWNRRYAYQAVGALGVIELTAPGRAAFVNEGLRRLGAPPAQRKYFSLHAYLDVQHSKAWNAEVLRSLVTIDVRVPRLLAEGALLRLNAGARCFARYRKHFGFSGEDAKQPPTAGSAAAPAHAA